MRLEHIPLIIGAIVALIGLAFIADGLMADAARPGKERRRRMRAERSRAGETIVGIGTLCMAAALIGRDTWRYGTLAVLVGAGLVLIGIILNRSFLKEALLFRGPARRADPSTLDSPHAKRPASSPKAPRPPVASRPDPAGQPATRPEMARPATRPEPAPAARPDVAPTVPHPAAPPAARADAAPPSGPVERRKNPRGKK
jgi:hypothetical protein